MVLLFGNESNHIPACIAAEAVIKICLGIYGKGWGLLFVEGTEANIVAALLFKAYAVRFDDRFKIMPLLDRLYICLRYPQPASFQKPVK